MIGMMPCSVRLVSGETRVEGGGRRIVQMLFFALSLVLLSGDGKGKDKSNEPISPALKEKARSPIGGFLPLSAFQKEGYWIESGLRIERKPKGIRSAREVFPAGGRPRGMALPRHLGGGFLFFQGIGRDGSTSTALYRSETWTGPLIPFARVPFFVRHIEPGPDRLFVLGITVQMALDVATGKVLPWGVLPPLVSLEGISFDGARRGLVRGPLVGILFTNNAGHTWQRLREATSIHYNLSGNSLLVDSSQGISEISDEGLLRPISKNTLSLTYERALSGHQAPQASIDEARLMDAFRQELPLALSAGALGGNEAARGYERLLSHGVLSSGVAYALHAGGLLRGEHGNYLLVSKRASALLRNGARSVQDACWGVPGGAGNPVFVCPGSNAEIFTLQDKGKNVPEPLRRVATLPGRRSVLAKGSGKVLFAGACASAADKDSLCLLAGNRTRTLRVGDRIEGFRKSEQRAVALGKDTAFFVFFQRESSTFSAYELPLSGKSLPDRLARRSWKLPESPTLADFLKHGLLLPQGAVVEGEVSLWAVLGERFVGLVLGEGETPSWGAIQRPLSRALLNAQRAMVWGAAGFAKQSVNGGGLFEEVSWPYRSGDGALAQVSSNVSQVQMGCSEVGCILGSLTRWGWEAQAGTPRALPQSLKFLEAKRSRFHFTCSEGGVFTKPGIAKSSQEFASFWEEKAPTLRAGEDGFSASFSGDFYRLYTWGPSLGRWTQKARSQVAFIDPWSPEHVRRSSVTAQLFPTSLNAQSTMGLLDRGSSFHQGAMDPGGAGGVLLLKTHDSAGLIAFFESQALERIVGAQEKGLRNLLSAVQARGRWYAAFQSGDLVSIFRLENGGLTLIGRFALGGGGRNVQLVRTGSGDLGISMEGDAGLFVYPLSVQGALGSPLIVPFQSKRPRACVSEAVGFIVDRAMTISPYLENAQGEILRVNSLRARWIVGHGEPCIDALRGRSRTRVSSTPARAHENSIPLSVLNVESRGNRVELLCH